MGYRLAGYSMEGFCEIDPKMAATYQRNMAVPLPCNAPIGHLIPDPSILGIDILDGSPPCSSFSTLGDRAKGWGKKKMFREGQTEQVLDDLFFQFIALAGTIKPKVIVAENVKGLILGDAKKYVAEIFLRMNDAGYETQLFLLNASRMGVPQTRERTVFIGRRKDLGLPKMVLEFNEPPVSIEAACLGAVGSGKPLTKMALSLWKNTPPGTSMREAHPRKSWFAHRRPHGDSPNHTIVAGTPSYHWREPRYLSDMEIIRVQSFPDDYQFGNETAQYVCGMSVPPLMMQRISGEVARQLFQIDPLKR